MEGNILQIVNYSSPYPGNLMRTIWEVDKYLLKNNLGKTIYVFLEEEHTRSWIREMENKGFTIKFKKNKNKKNLLYNYLVLNNIIKEHNIKIVHIHFWNIADNILIQMLKLFKKDLKSIVHHHNHYFESSSRFKESIKKKIINSDAHIACSVDVADFLVESGFDKRSVYGVNNGIDFERLEKEDERFNLNELGITSNKRLFLMFGFDYHRKGVDIVCKALAPIAEDENIVLGIPLQTNEEYVKEQISKIFKGTIPKWIKLLPPRDDIATYFKKATCFISASREEGFCTSVLESIYCGCETIQSNINGHRLDVPKCKIFKSEDHEDLRLRVHEVLNQKNEEFEKINEIQKKYVLNNYGLHKSSMKVIDVYRNLLKS